VSLDALTKLLERKVGTRLDGVFGRGKFPSQISVWDHFKVFARMRGGEVTQATLSDRAQVTVPQEVAVAPSVPNAADVDNNNVDMSTDVISPLPHGTRVLCSQVGHPAYGQIGRYSSFSEQFHFQIPRNLYTANTFDDKVQGKSMSQKLSNTVSFNTMGATDGIWDMTEYDGDGDSTSASTVDLTNGQASDRLSLTSSETSEQNITGSPSRTSPERAAEMDKMLGLLKDKETPFSSNPIFSANLNQESEQLPPFPKMRLEIGSARTRNLVPTESHASGHTVNILPNDFTVKKNFNSADNFGGKSKSSAMMIPCDLAEMEFRKQTALHLAYAHENYSKWHTLDEILAKYPQCSKELILHMITSVKLVSPFKQVEEVGLNFVEVEVVKQHVTVWTTSEVPYGEPYNPNAADDGKTDDAKSSELTTPKPSKMDNCQKVVRHTSIKRTNLKDDWYSLGEETDGRESGFFSPYNGDLLGYDVDGLAAERDFKEGRIIASKLQGGGASDKSRLQNSNTKLQNKKEQKVLKTYKYRCIPAYSKYVDSTSDSSAQVNTTSKSKNRGSKNSKKNFKPSPRGSGGNSDSAGESETGELNGWAELNVSSNPGNNDGGGVNNMRYSSEALSIIEAYYREFPEIWHAVNDELKKRAKNGGKVVTGGGKKGGGKKGKGKKGKNGKNGGKNGGESPGDDTSGMEGESELERSLSESERKTLNENCFPETPVTLEARSVFEKYTGVPDAGRNTNAGGGGKNAGNDWTASFSSSGNNNNWGGGNSNWGGGNPNNNWGSESSRQAQGGGKGNQQQGGGGNQGSNNWGGSNNREGNHWGAKGGGDWGGKSGGGGDWGGKGGDWGGKGGGGDWGGKGGGGHSSGGPDTFVKRSKDETNWYVELVCKFLKKLPHSRVSLAPMRHSAIPESVVLELEKLRTPKSLDFFDYTGEKQIILRSGGGKTNAGKTEAKQTKQAKSPVGEQASPLSGSTSSSTEEVVGLAPVTPGAGGNKYSAKISSESARSTQQADTATPTPQQEANNATHAKNPQHSVHNTIRQEFCEGAVLSSYATDGSTLPRPRNFFESSFVASCGPNKSALLHDRMIGEMKVRNRPIELLLAFSKTKCFSVDEDRFPRKLFPNVFSPERILGSSVWSSCLVAGLLGPSSCTPATSPAHGILFQGSTDPDAITTIFASDRPLLFYENKKKGKSSPNPDIGTINPRIPAYSGPARVVNLLSSLSSLGKGDNNAGDGKQNGQKNAGENKNEPNPKKQRLRKNGMPKTRHFMLDARDQGFMLNAKDQSGIMIDSSSTVTTTGDNTTDRHSATDRDSSTLRVGPLLIVEDKSPGSLQFLPLGQMRDVLAIPKCLQGTAEDQAFLEGRANVNKFSISESVNKFASSFLTQASLLDTAGEMARFRQFLENVVAAGEPNQVGNNSAGKHPDVGSLSDAMQLVTLSDSDKKDISGANGRTVTTFNLSFDSLQRKNLTATAPIPMPMSLPGTPLAVLARKFCVAEREIRIRDDDAGSKESEKTETYRLQNTADANLINANLPSTTPAYSPIGSLNTPLKSNLGVGSFAVLKSGLGDIEQAAELEITRVSKGNEKEIVIKQKTKQQMILDNYLRSQLASYDFQNVSGLGGDTDNKLSHFSLSTSLRNISGNGIFTQLASGGSSSKFILPILPQLNESIFALAGMPVGENSVFGAPAGVIPAGSDASGNTEDGSDVTSPPSFFLGQRVTYSNSKGVVPLGERGIVIGIHWKRAEYGQRFLEEKRRELAKHYVKQQEVLRFKQMLEVRLEMVAAMEAETEERDVGSPSALRAELEKFVDRREETGRQEFLDDEELREKIARMEATFSNGDDEVDCVEVLLDRINFGATNLGGRCSNLRGIRVKPEDLLMLQLPGEKGVYGHPKLEGWESGNYREYEGGW